MKAYNQMSREELLTLKQELERKYEDVKEKA